MPAKEPYLRLITLGQRRRSRFFAGRYEVLKEPQPQPQARTGIRPPFRERLGKMFAARRAAAIASKVQAELLKRVIVVGSTPEHDRAIDIWLDEIDRRVNGANAIRTVGKTSSRAGLDAGLI